MELVDEELEEVFQEQKDRLEAMEEELLEVRRRMDRLWYAVEVTDLEVNDIILRLRESGASGTARCAMPMPYDSPIGKMVSELRSRFWLQYMMAGDGGFEPPLPDPESGVLPLD